MGRQAWTLTRDHFHHLLNALGSDPGEAGEQYERLRRRLIVFFRSRGTPDHDACADEVLNIAAIHLTRGEPIGNLNGYCLGIARRIALERCRTRARADAAARQAATSDYGISGSEDERIERLERCLARLTDHDRDLILRYYAGDTGERIRHRQQLASGLGLPLNAVRIRAHRIRQRLEQMMRDTAEGSR